MASRDLPDGRRARALAVFAGLVALFVAVLAGALAWTMRSPAPHAGVVAPAERTEHADAAPGSLEVFLPTARRASAAAAEPTPSAAAAATAPVDEERADRAIDYVIRGRVVARGHRDFEFDGATLTLSDGWETFDPAPIDPDGVFVASGLAPGTWTAVVALPGAGAVEATALLTPLAPVATLALELPVTNVLDVVVRTGARGRQRARLLALQLVAHRRPPASGRTRDGLDEVGWATIDARRLRQTRSAERRLLLPEPTAAYLSLFTNGYRIATRALVAGETRVEWDLEPELWPPAHGSLRLRVLAAETGQWIEARLGTKAGGGWIGFEEKPREADGSVVLDELTVGWVEAVVHAEGYANESRWCFLEPGLRHEAGDVLLRSGVSITGVVAGPDGPEQIDLAAWRWNDEGGHVEAGSQRRARSRPDGRFAFRDLRPGTYLVRSLGPDEYESSQAGPSHSWVSGFLEVDASATVEDAHLPLVESGRLVLRTASATTEGWSYRIEDPDGRWLRTGFLGTSLPVDHHLAPGRYRVLTTDTDTTTREWSVDVGAEPVVVEL